MLRLAFALKRAGSKRYDRNLIQHIAEQVRHLIARRKRKRPENEIAAVGVEFVERWPGRAERRRQDTELRRLAHQIRGVIAAIKAGFMRTIFDRDDCLRRSRCGSGESVIAGRAANLVQPIATASLAGRLLLRAGRRRLARRAGSPAERAQAAGRLRPRRRAVPHSSQGRRARRQTWSSMSRI